MPKKNVTPTPETPQETAIVQEILGKCGHINRHSLGLDNKADNLACTRDRGHDGLHGADHLELVESTAANAEAIGRKRYERKKVFREWSDQAGTPVSQIQPQAIPLRPEDQAKIELARQIFPDMPSGTKFPQ